MAILHVTTDGGEKKEIESASGVVLMEALRDAGLVDATCGGVASCGTCHVYFDDKALVGERSEDEGYMLEGLEDYVEITDCSRLSCQVTVTDAFDNCKLTIAPEA